MLTKLSIHNYALINELSVDFSKGLSIITGETGAGKSILLGALGLVLGNRADLSSLKNTDKKCVIEAEFMLQDYHLETLFEEEDIDYEELTIIRREILPSGKSRAFINDTPVRLSVLNTIKTKLIDIHSQHQTLQLSDIDFQFSIIDALAKNQEKLASYKRGLYKLNSLKKDLKELTEQQQSATQEYEYNLHLYNELEEANLQPEEQTTLEEKLDKLNNIEEIKLNLSQGLGIAINEEVGIQSLLHSLTSNIHKISSYGTEYSELSERISSLKIEFDDIVSELESANEHIEFNPNELELINERLELIYTLQKKHQVSSVEELIVIQDKLSDKINQVANASDSIAKKQLEIDDVAQKLDLLAAKISSERTNVIPVLQKELSYLLAELGMPNARFAIEIKPSNTYFNNGKDELVFLFAANKGGNFGELKKVASGGELSRIMLSVKKILSENIKLPTIIFDEIDTGVSGEVSNKIAKIMAEMSNNMQVITITHLPQIAAKGTHHYKVFKKEIDDITTSNLKLLNNDERIKEIAEMLSGKDISESALSHAKELLN